MWQMNLNNKKLPDEPWELIRLAVADLEKAEQDPTYLVNLETWHAPFGDQCQVCLAGAVLAFSLGVSPTEWVSTWKIEEMPPELNRKLYALNNFRLGWIKNGYFCLERKLPDTNHWYSMPQYSDEPERFKSTLLSIAVALETAEDEQKRQSAGA